MPGLEDVKEEVHNLSKEISALRPLVDEMHGNMPRIATALETLARVDERLVSNAEDHKRIHYRITENEQKTERLSTHHEDLERRFEELKEEFLVCSTTSKVRLTTTQSGLWMRLKIKAAEKATEWIIIALLGFMTWIAIYHAPQYPATAKIIEQGRADK